jgi:hypothetical protein
MRIACIPLFFLSCSFFLAAQSPPEIFTAITYDSDTTDNSITLSTNRVDVDFISEAFDNGRRREEEQFSLNGTPLGNINMPAQSIWDAWGPGEKVLHILNEERTARGGVDYGNGPVKGLPLTGLESNLTNVAQNLANQLTVKGFSAGLDADTNIGGMGCVNNDSPPMDCCHEFLAPNQQSTSSLVSPAKGYKIVSQSNGDPFPGIEVRALYDLIYRRFGDRLALLIQDEDLNNTTSSQYGLDDNYGEMGDEGFLGVGFFNGPSPNGAGLDSTFLSICLMDPLPATAGCSYVCTTCGSCPAILVQSSVPIPEDIYQASDWIMTNGTVQSSQVDMQAGNFIEMDPMFEVIQGAIYHAYISDCFFTMN